MTINFTRYRRLYYLFSGILILASLIAIFVFGLKTGIEFTGGSLLELKFETLPSNQEIEGRLSELNLGEIIVQPTAENRIILRLKEIDEETHQQILKKLGNSQEMSFEAIGPSVGKELDRKSVV